MAGVGLLDGVHGQGPDGVDAELIGIGRGHLGCVSFVRAGMSPALTVRAGGDSAPPRPSASREALTMLPDTIADKRRSLRATRPVPARIRLAKKAIHVP